MCVKAPASRTPTYLSSQWSLRYEASGFLSNLQPALVPPPAHLSDSDVEEYFQSLADSDDGYTADSDNETDED